MLTFSIECQREFGQCYLAWLVLTVHEKRCSSHSPTVCLRPQWHPSFPEFMNGILLKRWAQEKPIVLATVEMQ